MASADQITPSPTSRLKEFQLIAGDVLQLIARMSKSQYKEQTQAADIVENFYDQCHAIISNQSLDLHEARLVAITEHVKASTFAAELKGAYNLIYQKYPELALELISKSHVPSKKDLENMMTPFKSEISDVVG